MIPTLQCHPPNWESVSESSITFTWAFEMKGLAIILLLGLPCAKSGITDGGALMMRNVNVLPLYGIVRASKFKSIVETRWPSNLALRGGGGTETTIMLNNPPCTYVRNAPPVASSLPFHVLLPWELRDMLISLRSVPPSQCEVMGSWNEWKERIPMNRIGDTKVFEAAITMAPGKHTFKFVLDGCLWICSDDIKQEVRPETPA